MKTFLTGAAVIVGLALAVPAQAAPGQCSVTGFGAFDCDVTADGGGVTFALPDGQTFVFAHESDGQGLGYLIPENQRPGRYPNELGQFFPVADEAGCWYGPKEEITFCASLIE